MIVIVILSCDVLFCVLEMTLNNWSTLKICMIFQWTGQGCTDHTDTDVLSRTHTPCPCLQTEWAAYLDNIYRSAPKNAVLVGISLGFKTHPLISADNRVFSPCVENESVRFTRKSSVVHFSDSNLLNHSPKRFVHRFFSNSCIVSPVGGEKLVCFDVVWTRNWIILSTDSVVQLIYVTVRDPQSS